MKNLLESFLGDDIVLLLKTLSDKLFLSQM